MNFNEVVFNEVVFDLIAAGWIRLRSGKARTRNFNDVVFDGVVFNLIAAGWMLSTCRQRAGIVPVSARSIELQ